MTELNLSNILSNIEHQNNKNGLYLIGTPIGNILDISLRALFIIDMVDIVLAEDTRVTKKMLNFYNLSKKNISYNDHNAEKMTEFALKMLKQGQSLALVSDAGTPLISDPGYKLVQACKANDVYVTSIPGPCSLINALILSGLPSHSFYFHGFLPHKSAAKLKELKEISIYKTSIILFESIHRIISTLTCINDVFGNIKISLAREMTKNFEEVITGNVLEILTVSMKLKGEFVVIIDNKENCV